MTRDQPVSVPLHVLRRPNDTARASRRGEPVTFGVPFPQGVCAETQAWHLVDAGNRRRPVQVRALDRWRDGSVRWLLVDARVDLESDRSAWRLEPCAADDRPPIAQAVAVDRTAGRVTVSTGVTAFTFTTGAARLFEASAPGRSDRAPDVAALTFVDDRGTTVEPSIRQVSVIEEGPLRTRIGLDLVLADGPLEDLAIEARLDLFAGLPAVRLSLRVQNPRRAEHPGNLWDLGDAGSLYLKDVAIDVTTGAPTSRAAVSASVDGGTTWQMGEAPFELYQDSSGGANWQSTAHVNRLHQVPNTFRGFRIHTPAGETAGLRATPVVELATVPPLAVAVPEFWQNFPKALTAGASGLTLSVFPPQYADAHELQGGEQKTHVCVLSFGSDAVTPQPLAWAVAPVVAGAAPDWLLSAPAVAWLGPDDEAHAALVETAVDGPDSFEAKREVVDEYGWRHFGEIYADHEAVRDHGPHPLVSHYNNQYDPIAGFLYQYFRTGDARWWVMADELARHVIDIDLYHTDRDKPAYNHGMFWHTYHYGDADTSTHRTYPRAGLGKIHGGGPSADHTYTTGLMLHYLLTGDEASKQSVAEIAQFILDADDGSKTVLRWVSRAPTGYASASGSYAYHGPGRAPANALNSLVDGHRITGNAAFLGKAEALIARVVHPTEDIGKLRLDDPENRWFYLMFLQSLGKYLGRKVELGQLDEAYAYGRACLLHYARWMADFEYPYLDRPERLEFPTETWAAHEVRKSDIFALAALHSAADLRDRFVERARFFFRNAVETLAAMPTRTLARPVIVLLSSGFVLPWLLRHPDASAPAPARAPEAWKRREPFVPQKQQARRRIVMLAAAGGAAFVLGGLALAWYLLR